MDENEFVFDMTEKCEMPLLPLRGLTAFPGMLLSFDVERDISVAALNLAMGVLRPGGKFVNISRRVMAAPGMCMIIVPLIGCFCYF